VEASAAGSGFTALTPDGDELEATHLSFFGE
jgi:hypothetical protein